MILGHLTFTYALQQGLKKKSGLLLFPLIVGAITPDLIDKPLNLAIGTSTRGPAHSLLIMGILVFILLRLLPKNRVFFLPFSAGVLVHIAQDFPGPTVFLWPLLGAWPINPIKGMGNNIYHYYFSLKDPIPLFFEVLSYPFCLHFFFARFRTGEKEAAGEPLSRSG